LNAHSRKSPGSIGTPTLGTTPPETIQSTATPNLNITNNMFNTDHPDPGVIGSPLKKQRGSIYDTDEEAMKNLLNKTGFAAPIGNVLGLAEAGQSVHTPPAIKTEIDEEEL
jgi:hypothetical protein